MSVIPLTLTISLCLVFTFIVFFLRETSRRRFGSVERESLLPLAEEIPRVVTKQRQGHECGCHSGQPPSSTRCHGDHSPSQH